MSNKIGMYVDVEQIYKYFEKCENKTKKFVSDVLVKSKKVVTEKLLKDTIKANMPAQGKYWTGDLRRSINTDNNVTWQGYQGYINVGYDFAKSGLQSLCIIYGTPVMKPAKKIRNDIYGSETKKEIKDIQNKLFSDLIGGNNGR